MTPFDALRDMFGLTGRQTEVLVAIMQYRDKHGYPPTLRDVGEAMGITLTAVVGHVYALRKKRALVKREQFGVEYCRARSLVPRVKFCGVGDSQWR